MVGTHYQVAEEIGAGGMGKVYRGTDIRTNQAVAIKQLKSEMVTAEMVERFRREGEALRALNHPNIVKMLDTFEHEGQHYLVMEYVPDGDLNDLLKRGIIDPQRCITLAIDLADALTRAHKLNIIHRDLKPANVLIAEDGTLRLTDFGVAYVGNKERVTDPDAIIGTVDYLAPEVLSGDSIDSRADIWAFGIMLFEMLSGQHPFAGSSISETLFAITAGPIPDLEGLCPEAPTALVDLVYRMLQRDRRARIASVRHVGAALEDILHGRETSTPIVSDRFATPTPEIAVRAKHNLPAQTTPFVGREYELAELSKLISDPKIRLITILAPGGMGKSRLSLEAAERQLPSFANGVYFVELAPLSDVSSIVSAMADAVGYQFQGDAREPKQQILDFLHNKNLLLVLDNFEHLVDSADVVTDMLHAAPEVRIIATSRQRLSQPGEVLFHLSGMDFPEWETPENALEFSAVQLFMNSALRAKPTFELTGDNLDYVARICRLVGGMPLGIVLAASWLALLRPDEIADEIQKGIEFLEVEAGEIPERQRSIMAVFEYSWNLMSEDEQQVFTKLSVFRGGFTREAAEAVASANLRVLMSLTNKSLIRRDSGDGRYHLHELLRQFAERRLESNPDESIIAADRHSAYYAEFLSQNWQRLKDHRQVSALEDIESEFDNVRTAWKRMVEQRNVSEIAKACGSIWLVAYRHSKPQEVFNLFESAINVLQSAPQTPDDLYLIGHLWGLQSWLLSFQARPTEGKQRGIQALNLHDQNAPSDYVLMDYFGIARNCLFLGEHNKVIEFSQKGLNLAEECGNLWMKGYFSFNLGMMLKSQGKTLEARLSAEQTMADAEKIGDIFLVALTECLLLTPVYKDLGLYGEAKRLCEHGLNQLTAMNIKWASAIANGTLASIAVAQGQFKEAERWFIRRFRLDVEQQNIWDILLSISNFAELYAVQGKRERALELSVMIHHHPGSLQMNKEIAAKLNAALQAELPPDIYAAAWERGKRRELDQVVQELLDEFAQEG